MHTDPIAQGVAHFNAGEYRAALLAFEARWHDERSETLRSLILLSNALNQIQLGLFEGPRRNLMRAAELLRHAPPRYEGIDMAGVYQHVTRLLALLSAAEAPLPRDHVPGLILEQTDVI